MNNILLKEYLDKIEYKLQCECERLGDKIPYIAIDKKYNDMREENISWWTNGFFAGILWQLYNRNKNECFKKKAENIERELDKALEKFDGLHHDVGFMYMHTAVANFKITNNEKSKSRGLHAATLLAGRFNIKGNFIRSWNLDKTGWVIIDCMMNLPLLYWASKELEDPRFQFMADAHAKTVMNTLIRPDGSCNHIGVFDPYTGEWIEALGGQGYDENSSWSRGQAWSLYGFALTYKNTGEAMYLDVAKRAAHYFISNICNTDFVSYVDFRAPESPKLIDTTACICAACGMLEIAKFVPEYEQKVYINSAKTIVEVLMEKYCDFNPDNDGILQYGTAAYHKVDEKHVPIVYGDYFLIEAILRLENSEFDIWGK